MNRHPPHYDICVIGAGAGGLSLAAGAAQMGARVALVERSKMGGECLHHGCVPSKALLAAAGKAQSMREAPSFGIISEGMRIDMQQVHRHVRESIAAIAPHDSQERFESLGVHVLRASARFVDHSQIQAGEQCIRARYFVIATGSSPFVPAIPGLEKVAWMTNETLFDIREPIEHLLVIGGGAVGLEMAQAIRRLGARVTVMESQPRLLPREDPECVDLIVQTMRKEGVEFIIGGSDPQIEAGEDGSILAHCRNHARHIHVRASHLLIATGRRANVQGLELENAGVRHDKRGIIVDARMRTSNRRIYAIGDVTGHWQFTHIASQQANVVLRNILFGLPTRMSYRAAPRVIYSDPELAQVGMLASEAKRQGITHRIRYWPWERNDRARIERRCEGLTKVVLRPNGKILGVSIVGLHAGELIQPWVLALHRGLSIRHMASMIAPYPTLAESNRHIAGDFYRERLFSERTRGIVRLLLRWRS